MTALPRTKHPPGHNSQRVQISFNDIHNNLNRSSGAICADYIAFSARISTENHDGSTSFSTFRPGC